MLDSDDDPQTVKSPLKSNSQIIKELNVQKRPERARHQEQQNDSEGLKVINIYFVFSNF